MGSLKIVVCQISPLGRLAMIDLLWKNKTSVFGNAIPVTDMKLKRG